MLRTLLLASLLLAGCLPAVPLSEPVPEPLPAGVDSGIVGRVLDVQGRPAAGAWVYAYRSQRSGLRGPADFGARVEAAGDYLLDLTAGEYYLVARRRQSGADAGPPRIGDAWSIHPANPVRVREGALSRADFSLQGVAQPMLLRGGSLSAGDTGFSGRLVDGQRQPLAGAFALAYRGSDFRRMPDHTSPAVGEDGRFTLFVPEAGRYCLAARTRTRGQPIQGEPYGLLGTGEAGCRQAVTGKILEVGTIQLTPYLR